MITEPRSFSSGASCATISAPDIWPRGPFPPAPRDSGPLLYAYGLDLRSANPAAPPLPPRLLAAAFETSRRTIVEQLHAVERSDEVLRRHLADTRHDLVTPLTVLQGHLAALELRLGEAADSEQRRLLAAAAEECDYLARLLENLGATTALRAGEAFLEASRFDLNPVVERIVGRYRRLARSRSVGLDFSVPPAPTTVEGDLTVCERAIGNLVDNALRYNRRGGNVAVLLEHDGASTFVLQVIDDGPGVGDASLSELRARGARLGHARSRFPRGQGLGLDIVISVAEHHGWSFELCSRKPRGLTASLAGPRAASHFSHGLS